MEIFNKMIGSEKRGNHRPRHPGEVLKDDILVPFSVNQRELVERLSWTYLELDEFIFHQKRLTPEMAQELAFTFGTTAEYWLRLQLQFDLWQCSQIQSKNEIPLLSFTPLQEKE